MKTISTFQLPYSLNGTGNGNIKGKRAAKRAGMQCRRKYSYA